MKAIRKTSCGADRWRGGASMKQKEGEWADS